jgi:hypothetical protein
MKILKLHSRQFPNALHVQCMTEIGDWAPKYPDLQVKIQGLYNPYMLWLTRETTAYQHVVKSAVTAAKETKDRERGDCFHGLYYDAGRNQVLRPRSRRRSETSDARAGQLQPHSDRQAVV